MSTSVQIINDSCLPFDFKNVICKSENNKIIMRSNLKNMQDVNKWVTLFGQKTNTQWNARSSCSEGIKIICSKKFVCHHSAFMKIPANKNKRGLSKNANCQASILIVVKLDNINTRKKDKFIKEGMQAVITIEKEHSHTLQTAETVRFLQAKSEIKNVFFEYFNDGMTISEAKKFHEQLYEFDENRELLLASGSENPTYRSVQNWYHTWRNLNLGPRTGEGLLKKLIEKQSLYEEKGTKILFSKEPFAVAVVTPIMARGHALQFSKEICFVDSTSACDSEQHSVTFVTAPCAAGAVPLGIIITRGQTYEAYCKGFQLLQDAVSNTFQPKMFLTANSDAEILALNTVFPKSTTLLCIFHVLQAVWRWLWDSKHGIAKEDRQELMERFRKILYSQTFADADRAFYDNNNTRYGNWKQYIQGYWDIKEKWCLAWRNENSKGHYINNFCEISIRLFKDNVLCRVKANNVIALIDVVSSVLEEFYRRKLREFANSRSSNARIYFLNTLQKTSYLEKSDIICISEFNFKVRSSKCKDAFYLVNVEYGFCSCIQGTMGKFCKHQCAIYKFFEIETKCFPPVTTEDRYNIAKLALGDDAPTISFYKPFLIENNYNTCSKNHFEEMGFCDKDNSASENTHYSNNKALQFKSSMSTENNNSTITEICETIKSYHELFGSSTKGLKILKDRLMAIKSERQWETFIHTAGNSMPLRGRSNAAIKVQSTSISRRAPRVTRGSRRLPSGRRCKNELINKKRKRNLSLSIKLNKPNAKSHDFNH